MNKNILIVLSLALLSLSSIKSENQKSFCITEANCEDINNSCQCYCAIERHPRDKVPGQDYPIFFQKEQDPYGKGCYCGARDLLVIKDEQNGISHDEAVAKYKNFFPNEEETLEYKEEFIR